MEICIRQYNKQANTLKNKVEFQPICDLTLKYDFYNAFIKLVNNVLTMLLCIHIFR